MDDGFDETLESALKLYQSFYRLKVTGKLDADAVKQMSIPRCGVPDFIRPRHASRNATKPNKLRIVLRCAPGPHVTAFTFNEVSSDETPDVSIGFYSSFHGDTQPFDGPGRILAHSTYPNFGLSHYDVDEPWSVNSSPTQLDLESVALHEIGHLLGLAQPGSERRYALWNCARYRQKGS
ncbi:hypothetical protein ACJRO7_035387 [Eucalyptus globulus]|uniref:Peptidase metallopeptidase domain-containing protein n=1 Tax=Eucalyptus globulus TaxID=34317 RepID=A0ABD3J8Q9_EUCGL